MQEPLITDEDAEKIAAKLEERLVRRFHLNLGRGVWGLAWRAIVAAVALLAVYGAFRGRLP